MDWPAIWAGPPNPGQALDDWCAIFGWVPIGGDRVLSVRSATGGKMSLDPVIDGGWSPVKSLGWTTWSMGADTSDENDSVLERACGIWPAYVAAIRSVLGEPEFSGAWDDPAFPEPLNGTHWLPSRDTRLRSRTPYRLAVWRDASSEGRVTALELRSGGVTRSGVGKRGVMIDLDCHPRDAA
ncbi:hypothetical protein [Streptomyces sp. H27-C3]|uniref:hypothetical protein n=1 Tax=Streptomyces sp. H27-C3 TaxID=3046305 RepID=UPI0024BAEC79|nr:hypothetical protein [Streptomyces sp. H27-C3]MDJ0464308.1 hypothetical protein [Streptomyces sp. H27-C3]